MIPYDTGIAGWNDLRRIFIRFLVMTGDAVVVMVAYGAAFAIRFYFRPFLAEFPATKGIPEFIVYLKAAPVIVFMWVLVLSWDNCYARVNLPALDDLIRLFRVSIGGTVLSMSAMFLYRESSFSRLVFSIGGTSAYFLLYMYRQALKAGYLTWIQGQRRPHRVLVIGDSYLSRSLQRILRRQGDRAVLMHHKFDIEAVKRAVIRSRIGELLLAHPEITHKKAVDLAGFCEERGIVFRLIPDILEIRMGEVLIDESLGVPTFQIKPISLQGSAFITKRLMDVSLSALLIGIFFIPLLVIAILIKITSIGGIFYEHERVGFRQRPFQFMKFRTMVSNADVLLQDLKIKSDRNGPVFKMKNDPRITAIGKVLRRYSLDEVPQLINVLRGEMSLVGPRPQVLWEAQAYDEWARKRLNVLPGITGLWQVSGRALLTYEEMIDLDIFYIEHWSPGLDARILLKTIPAVLSAKGAY
jgi:exopolysaccharide biosynthesis polyprenyl glycosylphosphotransferase